MTDFTDDYEDQVKFIIGQYRDYLKSQGLTIVPIEPTPGMRVEGRAACDPFQPSVKAIYKAMNANYEEKNHG